MGKVGKKPAAWVLALAVGVAASVTQHFEGTQQAAYLDPVGVPTVCSGHTQGVALGQIYTEAECAAMLKADVDTAMASVLALVQVPLSPFELGAYTSFVFNLGHGNFARSTLLKKLNAGEREGACSQLHRWVHAGGRKLPGLVARRQAEYQLCMTPWQGV